MAQHLSFKTLPQNPEWSETCDVFLCNGFSIPSFGIKFLKEYYASFVARQDDVYVISYPKTGTTWTQEIAYLLCKNLDFELAKSKGSMEKVPYIEHRTTNVGGVVNMPSPRLLKSHFPYSLLPPDILEKKCKLIYVTRNPKDVVVSYYHFATWIVETKYQGTFDQFLERFMSNRTTYSPFLLHNLEFWEHRNDPNVLFLFYEDMIKNLADTVKKIAIFLEKQISAEDVDKIVNHCSFDNMSKELEGQAVPANSHDTKTGKFFRKGKVGDWKNYFSEEQSRRMDDWVEQELKGSALKYTYEL